MDLKNIFIFYIAPGGFATCLKEEFCVWPRLAFCLTASSMFMEMCWSALLNVDYVRTNT